MKHIADISFARKIMLEFADITGLEPSSQHPKRYLWTDAFAVCNYLELFKQTSDEFFLNLATKLVDQVHLTLGRHREDDPRTGWISGLNENDGELHPTIGGLRIGKQLNERMSPETFNERLEWDRDGQYYHYLTKWMHALNRVSRITEDPRYTRYALELAQAAHASFTYSTNGKRRMYWKMSIDLSHPLVPSMGQHDPLDGYITYNELNSTARDFWQSSTESNLPNLSSEIGDMVSICQGMSWITDDPLGIGGLLSDALRISQLTVTTELVYSKLLINILDAALIGLKSFLENSPLDFPAEYRLAFRELGLSIGIKGVWNLHNLLKSNKNKFQNYHYLQNLIDSLMYYMPLAVAIENFWMNHKNRKINTWIEHKEINMVMLATNLAPDGFLNI